MRDFIEMYNKSMGVFIKKHHPVCYQFLPKDPDMVLNITLPNGYAQMIKSGDYVVMGVDGEYGVSQSVFEESYARACGIDCEKQNNENVEERE